MAYKIDLHTHSWCSPDGGITLEQYSNLLKTKQLDYIAITDHDTIEGAVAAKQQLGDCIIIGQEITTAQGEIIGLFLTSRIEPNMSAQETVDAIKAQSGLVYIPHPFETVRKGLSKHSLDLIADSVDIVETYNARAIFQNKGPQAVTWARLHHVPGCASSDAHGQRGIGSSFTTIASIPTAPTLAQSLQTATMTTTRPPVASILYPKYYRLRGRISKNLKIKKI